MSSPSDKEDKGSDKDDVARAPITPAPPTNDSPPAAADSSPAAASGDMEQLLIVFRTMQEQQLTEVRTIREQLAKQNEKLAKQHKMISHLQHHVQLPPILSQEDPPPPPSSATVPPSSATVPPVLLCRDANNNNDDAVSYLTTTASVTDPNPATSSVSSIINYTNNNNNNNRKRKSSTSTASTSDTMSAHVFVDEGFKEKTMSELKGRRIEKDKIQAIAALYAFENYGIPSLQSVGGGSKSERFYACSSCQNYYFRFKECGVDTWQLDTPSKNAKPRVRSTNSAGVKSPMVSFQRLNKIRNGEHFDNQHAKKCCMSTGTTYRQKSLEFQNQGFGRLIILNSNHFPGQFRKEFSEEPTDAIRQLTKKKITSVLGNVCILMKVNHSIDGTSLKQIFYAYVQHLYTKKKREYFGFDTTLAIIAKNNPTMTVVMQCDAHDRFLRLFIGLPIALHLDSFFFPVIICDGTHYRTSSYTGKIFGFYAHDSFGTSILIAVAIIPEENIRHLAWTLECWIRHGMSVSLYPWFTDQGNFLHTAKSLVRGRHPTAQSYRNKIDPNLHICDVHYIRSSYYPYRKVYKEAIEYIEQGILSMSRSLNTNDFFVRLFKHLITMITNHTTVESLESVFSYGIRILRVHPKHWSMYANYPDFQPTIYARLRKLAI